MKLTPREFRMLDREGRVRALAAEGLLSDEQADALLADQAVLPLSIAEHMIENTIGVFGLPLAVAPAIVVNDRPYDVPMAIEEPSVVAAQCNSAKVVRESGGYTAGATDPVMIGQVQLVDVPDLAAAEAAIVAAESDLQELANEAIPGIVRRGGGMRGLRIRRLHHPDDEAPMLVVHLHIDVREAMGANAVNTVAEHVASRLEELAGGRAVLRILSNLTDLRRAWAECSIRTELLAVGEMSGAEVATGIEAASKLAEIDPWRAATHNKGAMNGIDAVVIATGNDFRAVEAGAHAWAARDGFYGSMTTWRVRGDRLWGRIEIPLALGTVGGQVGTHPWVRPMLGLMGVQSSAELAMVVAAVGLGQNLAAIRQLASAGIQAGHMAMHARAIALEVGAEGAEVQQVADALRALGQIDRDTARAVLQELRAG
ncbi:MAG: hydroxymethylglutaryl-CoA reductase, degradative [Candidatus Dadabacteria bacterium]|nr:MAG: hydroxymethylglutaryl-CoA reductase, degradative [Candidatus Dadabacteria bacterium]